MTRGPVPLTAVTVIWYVPVNGQLKETASVKPPVWVMGACPSTCQTVVMGVVAANGVTVVPNVCVMPIDPTDGP